MYCSVGPFSIKRFEIAGCDEEEFFKDFSSISRYDLT
jgi:hypothetical protein